MSIAEDLESGPQPQPQGIPEGATGQELAAVVQQSLMSQAQSLASLAQNANANVELIADQVVPYLASVIDGQSLMSAVLTRLSGKLAQQQPMAIASQVEPIQMELPRFESYDPAAAEERFKQFIGSARRSAILPAFSRGES